MPFVYNNKINDFFFLIQQYQVISITYHMLFTYESLTKKKQWGEVWKFNAKYIDPMKMARSPAVIFEMCIQRLVYWGDYVVRATYEM